MVLEAVAEAEEGLLLAVEVEGKCGEPQISSLIRLGCCECCVDLEYAMGR